MEIETIVPVYDCTGSAGPKLIGSSVLAQRRLHAWHRGRGFLYLRPVIHFFTIPKHIGDQLYGSISVRHDDQSHTALTRCSPITRKSFVIAGVPETSVCSTSLQPHAQSHKTGRILQIGRASLGKE